MTDMAELAVRVTSQGIEKVKGDLASIGTTGEAAAAKVSSSFSGSASSARVLQGQLDALAQITGNWGGASAQARDMARQMASALQQSGAMAQASAAQIEQLAAAELAMAGAAAKATQQVEAAAVANTKAAASSGMHGLQLGRLNMEIGTFIGRVTGANTAMTRLGAMIGGNIIGYMEMIGALAAVAGLLWVWDKMTEGARKAKEEQDKLTESLRKWYQTKHDGDAGQRSHEVANLQSTIAGQLAEVASLSKTQGAGGFIAGGVNATRIAELRREIADERAMIADGEKDITQTWTDSFQRQRDQQIAALAERLKFNQNDAAARKQALDLLKQDQALYAQYLQLPVSDANSALVAKMAAQITSLKGSLFPTEEAGPAVHAASVTTNPAIESFLKQGDEMRKANIEGNKMLATAQQDLELAKTQGLAHDLLANAFKAENEAMAARATLSGPALTQMLADIDATHKLADATTRAKFAHDLAKEAAKEEGKELKKTAEEAEKAAKAEQQIVDTMVKDVQRDFASFFDSILAKGVTSFRTLFDEIKAMFYKLVADMIAAELMKKIAGPLTAAIGGILGTASSAAAQSSGGSGGGGTVTIGGVTLPAPQAAKLPGVSSGTMAAVGKGLGEAGIGFGIGSFIGSHTTNRALGALGGAAGGAAAGFAMGGPVGAIIGGAAGLVGGFLGAKHSAEAAAKALEAMKAAAAQVHATLADWRAQVTGLARDQKAAAEADLRWKYLSIKQTIEQVEAGKKMEEQRNKDLAEAASIYAEAQKKATAGLGAFTDALNEVTGYKPQLNALIYAASGGYTPPSSGGSTGRRDGSTASSPRAPGANDNTPVTLVLADGTHLGTAVLKGLKAKAQRQYGDSSRWSEVQ